MSLSTHERLQDRSHFIYQDVKRSLYEAFPQPTQDAYLGLLADVNPEKAAFLADHIANPEFINPNETIRLIESHVIVDLVEAIVSPLRLTGKLREKPTSIRQKARTKGHFLRSNGTHTYPHSPPRLLRIP